MKRKWRRGDMFTNLKHDIVWLVLRDQTMRSFVSCVAISAGNIFIDKSVSVHEHVNVANDANIVYLANIYEGEQR